jgi:hypothetical protein
MHDRCACKISGTPAAAARACVAHIISDLSEVQKWCASAAPARRSMAGIGAQSVTCGCRRSCVRDAAGYGEPVAQGRSLRGG